MKKIMAQTERASFGSKIGMVLATAGGAVGLGNVWRFPYMTGENGGAAFIIVYIGCVLLLGIPCMINEFIIGRHAASNTARAYSKLSGGKAWKWVGMLGVLTGFLITGYYAVVSGWCLEYVIASLTGQLHGSPDYFKAFFADFETNPWEPMVCTLAILLITHFVIIHGVRNGIERASKIMMPTLFILLLVIVVASCMLPGAMKGIDFLFKPDFSKVDSGVFLGALGQSFYSLSIAMGCICTYASYYTRQTNLINTAAQTCTIDTVVAILAGLMIFPAAFSIGVNPDSGPSLIFITLPNVFEKAFAGAPVLGFVISFAFYALLAMAALTSLISLHEVSTAFFQEELHISRKSAATIVTASAVVIGFFCSMSLGQWSFLEIGGKELFDIFDFVTGQIFLPVGGFLTCIFVGWFIPKKIIKDEFTNWGTLKGRLFGVYFFLVRIVCPLCILAIFLHQFGLI